MKSNKLSFTTLFSLITLLISAQCAFSQQLYQVESTVELQSAVAVAQSGDTISVASGEYVLTEPLVIGAGVHLKGAGAETTIIRSSDQWIAGPVEDTEISANSLDRTAHLLDLQNQQHNIEIDGFTLRGPDIHGAIVCSNCDGLAIHDNVFEDFRFSSVRLVVIDGGSIVNNRFIDAGGKKNVTSGYTAGAIFLSYAKFMDIGNNKFEKTPAKIGNFYGIKGRQLRDSRIHHNTILVNFSIEFPFENDARNEIDHNFMVGVVSIPKYAGGLVLEDQLAFDIHHNVFTSTYAIEFPRNHVDIHHNLFSFDVDDDGGNLISSFASKEAPGEMRFFNNIVENPGRGVMWIKGIYNAISIRNNEIFSSGTFRDLGFFGFHGGSDFSTVEIVDNILENTRLNERPLFRNTASYGALVENNRFENLSDSSLYSNTQTGNIQGLIDPLDFSLGYNNEYKVDGRVHYLKSDAYFEIPQTFTEKIQAEHFDAGGLGTSYVDDSYKAGDSQIRPLTSVDLQQSRNDDGTPNIGWTRKDEWVQYTVDVDRAGPYLLNLQVATPKDNRSVSVTIDGASSELYIDVPNTGNWQNWQTVTLDVGFSTKGYHIIRVGFGEGSVNLNWLQGELNFADPLAYFGYRQFLTDKIQTEHYDTGGLGVSYYDVDQKWGVSDVRRSDITDFEACADEGGTYNLGWTTAGEYLIYSVEVQDTADYSLELRIASPYGSEVSVLVDGLLITSVIIPNTGGWQNWESVFADLGLLSKGPHTITIRFDQGNMNFNWLQGIASGNNQ